MARLKPEACANLTCFHCGKRPPVERVVISEGLLDIYLCLCDECLKVSPVELIQNQLEEKEREHEKV